MVAVAPSRSQLPIGVFDSGVGGLTVLRVLSESLPEESFLYLGDTARLPYGTKSPETICRYALQTAQILAECGIKMLVIACNTASAHALDHLQQAFPDIPVIGVIEAGARAAVTASRNGRIAVIGTEGTIRAAMYDQAIHRLEPAIRITSAAASLFVPLAEEGLTEGPIATMIAHHYLDPLFCVPEDKRSDCLVLGCTHFPTLTSTVQAVVGPDVTLVDSASTTARMVKEALKKSSCSSSGNSTRIIRYLATDAPERFARVAATFLPWSIRASDVELIDLS